MRALHLFLRVLCLSSVVSGYFWAQRGFRYGFRSCKCGWQFGGKCKASCDYGEYVLGPAPCADGRYGVCCAKDLPCSSYGGECLYNGCHPDFQTNYTYKVRCPDADQTCCLMTTKYETTPTTDLGTDTTDRQCPAVTGRILGGSPVDSVCQWPWMVSLRLGTVTNAGPAICAGILLSDTKVLTTASCAMGNTLVATFGERDITQHGELGETNINVSIPPLIHPDYDTSSYTTTVNGADLAILTLDGRAPNSDCTSAACLPLTTNALERDNCRIAGWGLNEAFDGQLHEASVNLLTNNECGQIFSFLLNSNTLPDDKLCSFPVIDQTDACIGDNGGMLVCQDSSGNWKLFGIISDNACSRTLPVLYTDIQHHLEWIENNM